MAPEIFTKKFYDFKYDVWGLGVIMFIMLTGHTPFKGKDFKSIIKDILKIDPDWDLLQKNNISDPTLVILKKFLIKDPKERITLTDAIQEPWLLSNNRPLNTQTSDQVTKNINISQFEE